MASNLMGIGSLKSNLTSPQRSFIFEVRIPQPQGSSGANPVMLTVRAESTTIPKRGNSPIKLAYKQTAGMVIQGVDTNDHKWSVVFKEGEDAAVYTMIRKWQNQMVDAITGKANGPYQTYIYCALQDVNGNDTMVVTLHNAWISGVDSPSLNYTTGDAILKYTVEFSFDDFSTSVD